MSKMVQIRNMPEAMHRKLKSRAAQAGMSLSHYLLRELKRSADKPTVEELLDRIRSREPVRDVSAADLVRQGRAERDRQMREWLHDRGRR